jgi:hypothetical protein
VPRLRVDLLGVPALPRSLCQGGATEGYGVDFGLSDLGGVSGRARSPRSKKAGESGRGDA